MDDNALTEKYYNELYHHGVVGMKWGVRRYQNKDGSLTNAGKRRYGTKANFEKVQAAKKAAAKANSKQAIARRKANERTAAEVAKYGATCNSISPGGVKTCSNAHILQNPELYREVLNETMLGKWATPGEIATWVYFVATVNRSMTAQDIIIDNGELAKFNFVW